MIKTLLKLIFGTANERHLKEMTQLVAQINSLEDSFVNLTDEQLKNCTAAYKARLAAGETLDSLLPEAFALVREAAKRTLGQRHYDVQLMGGIALHKGRIAEMKTGEGKTLVATLPAYLNALTGKGVHIVTVNDYLAHRDIEWMGRVYKFLGLTVGWITHGLTEKERRAAYNADITHTTNHELAFDYLRDNMKHSLEHMVQRPFHYAIVDEVDSILIDEARTPLVISGPSEDRSELYATADKLVKKLAAKDFEVDEKHRHVSLTDEGTTKVESQLAKAKLIKPGSSLFDIENIHMLHHVNQALRANNLFKNDVDYIVRNGEVMLIDEFTGRIMDGRRFSDGLHQALEAKENVDVQNENQTLASITYQNYFRLYPKLSGMTGTAATEAEELHDIYNLTVVSIPTKNPVIRKDEDDIVYRTQAEKYNAIVDEIVKAHEKQQPILVGTISIEKSEHVSALLTKKGIKHRVLNAKQHEKEAYIIAQAGQPGAVTIATNMAGRGTDIMLGGNAEMLAKEMNLSEEDYEDLCEQVKEDRQKAKDSGGLLVIGTERHESRRIDNQLRGRSGRMGDPGRSVFYLSLQDDLMRIFASDKISGILKSLGMVEGDSVVHPLVSRTIEKAQNKVEMRNYEARKSLLKFDDVMNDQRKLVYQQRYEILAAENIHNTVINMTKDLTTDLVSSIVTQDSLDVSELAQQLHRVYGQDFGVLELVHPTASTMIEHLNAQVEEALDNKRKSIGEELFDTAEKRILLMTLDQVWKDHLLSLDHLKHGIHLRSYGQRDPLNEYKKEAFEYFERMLDSLRELYINRIMHVEVSQSLPAIEDIEDEINGLIDAPEVGRNDPCPCGSGEKYKRCHGKI